MEPAMPPNAALILNTLHDLGGDATVSRVSSRVQLGAGWTPALAYLEARGLVVRIKSHTLRGSDRLALPPA